MGYEDKADELWENIKAEIKDAEMESSIKLELIKKLGGKPRKIVKKKAKREKKRAKRRAKRAAKKLKEVERPPGAVGEPREVVTAPSGVGVTELGGSELSELKKGKRQKEKEVNQIKKELRAIKTIFSPPKPEITMFEFRSDRFYPYSTSEEEERLDSSYFLSLATLYSGGENIARAFQDLFGETDLHLEQSEMFSLLPLRRDVVYVGKALPHWLFSIKTEKFPKNRLGLPERVNWKKYPTKEVQIVLARQIDLMLRAGKSNDTYARLLPIMADLFRTGYQTAVKKLEELQNENFALFLLRTPQSRLSPFISIRIERKEEKAVTTQIFPVWFAYDELKLIQAGGKIKAAWKELNI